MQRTLAVVGAALIGGHALAQDGRPAPSRAAGPAAAVPAAAIPGAYGQVWQPWPLWQPWQPWPPWPGAYAGWCAPPWCGVAGPWQWRTMLERQRRFDELRAAATPAPAGLAAVPWIDPQGRYLPPPTPEKQIQPAYRDRSVVRPEFRDSGQALQ